MAGFDLGGGLTVDEYGNVVGGNDALWGPGSPGSGDFFSGGASGVDFPGNPYANGGGFWSGAGNVLSSLGDGLGGLWNSISGMLPSGDTATRLLPGLMALGYAARQPGIDVGPLNSVLGQLGGNQDAIVRAATDPVQRNLAAGYGDLLQSQGLRGIRGSSFGDTAIKDYLATGSDTLANAGARAAQGSLALQGDLAANIAKLKNEGQQIKNSLYGRAFDVLGRGLNPSGYAGNINIGGTPGGAPGGGSNPLSLLSGLGGLLGSGLGKLKGLFSGGGGLMDTAGAGDVIPFAGNFA